MAKIRHIAIRSEDVAETAKFFQEVFGLKLVQVRDHGPIDLTDGDINITLLPTNMGGRVMPAGFEHIGFTDADNKAVEKKLLDHNAKELAPVALGEAFYEAKFMSTEGLVLDVGHWKGASPVPETAAAGA